MLQYTAVAVTLVMLAGCATGGESHRSITRTERARLHVEIATGAITEGDWTGALQSLAQAEALDPTLPSLYQTRAVALIGRGMPKEALASALKAVEILPTYPEANNTAGKLLLDQGKYAEAEKYLKAAAGDILYRDSYKAQTNLAILHYRKGENAQAREYLNQAVRSSPQQACAAYYYRGHVNLRENKVLEAIEDYDRASHRLCSRFADAHLALGIAYERGQQYEKARKKYLDVAQNFSSQPAGKQAAERLRYVP